MPIDPDGSSVRLDDSIPGRLIVRYGRNPRDLGIAVTTPGSICLDGLEVTPGPSSSEIEAALTSILVGMLDIAGSVTANATETKVTVEVSKPRLSYQNIWYYRSLGSPIASMAATVVSEAFDKPVTVTRDEVRKGKAVIELEVLG